MLPIDADDCLYHTVTDCLGGSRIVTKKDESYEILNYQTGMSNPRKRITTHPQRPLNIVSAVARFVWMMSGSNRMEDIAFYEPKVRGYTDDDLTVPGSCYGHRLFDSAPGLNQIQGVIDRLVLEPLSRQACAVIWLPEDAVRSSRDIPCTFGLFFHERENKLTMTTVMRSNNAFRLLPFNLFEFSMLQEVVAASLRLELGDYVHWASSMHVYNNEFEMPVTLELAKIGPVDSIEMPPMPQGNVMQQIRYVAQFEAQLRHICTNEDFEVIIDKAFMLLNPYWLELLGVLAIWHCAKRNIGWLKSFPPYLEVPVRNTMLKAFPKFVIP